MDEIGGIGSFCCSRESTSEAVLQRERERERVGQVEKEMVKGQEFGKFN